MNSFSEIYNSVLLYFKDMVAKGELSPTAYDLWIKDIVPEKMEGSAVHLRVKNEMSRSVVESKYADMLKTAFNSVIGFEPDISISVESQPADDADTGNDMPANPDLRAAYRNAEYLYTFDTFIVGKSNQFAHAACVAVANNPGYVYNPLFIYGPPGMGKTHLLQAVSNQLKTDHPEMAIVYVTGEAFTTELIESIQKGKNMEFKHKYRSADVLLMDDVQFISGKESTQEEFFHTFNELRSLGKQIVLTSDRPPKDISSLADRIKSRFEQGLIADISTPDFETRMAIVKRKALLLDLSLDEEVITYIATRLKANVRQLEGCVKKLKAYQHLMGTSPTITQAQAVISEILTDNDSSPIGTDNIISEVAAVYSVRVDDIRSDKRSKQISTARKVCAYVLKELTPMSLKQIGAELGNKDHSSVSGYINDVRKMMNEQQVTHDNVEDIIRNLRSRV
ncbi:MAG: chromosomal replication initiator protein DnaA [Oscillospiraceae bacterium]|nr:chromosomal replication initiator protein DnaA [Oscillospiraceae bacterium]